MVLVHSSHGLVFFNKNIITEMKRKMATRLDNDISTNENPKRLKFNQSTMNEFIKIERDIYVISEKMH